MTCLYWTMGLMVLLSATGALAAYISIFKSIPTLSLARIEQAMFGLLLLAVLTGWLLVNIEP